ncbi:MAG TPA: hypothetical protein VNZ49_05935 [Bacteroidia bacterium]|nr:hypothetical protein [Bacteroidia bacterium]
MHKEITGQYNEFISELSLKKLKYEQFKSQLIPQKEKHEMALVFNTLGIENPWYGKDIYDKILPLFKNLNNHCFLEGDILSTYANRKELTKHFENSLIGTKRPAFEIIDQFFVVYINNLAPTTMIELIKQIETYPAYAGYLDMTYRSPLKSYLSGILVQRFCLLDKNIIVSSGEEEIVASNTDTVSYGFPEYGYKVISISNHNYSSFLTYKIEREILPHFGKDTKLSINAVTENSGDINEFSIVLEEKKLKYLQEQKLGSLKRVGLDTVNQGTFSEIIKSNIQNNYIYNLDYTPAHKTVKFNTMIELYGVETGLPHKMLVALEYIYEKKELRVITFY